MRYLPLGRRQGGHSIDKIAFYPEQGYRLKVCGLLNYFRLFTTLDVEYVFDKLSQNH